MINYKLQNEKVENAYDDYFDAFTSFCEKPTLQKREKVVKKIDEMRKKLTDMRITLNNIYFGKGL